MVGQQDWWLGESTTVIIYKRCIADYFLWQNIFLLFVFVFFNTTDCVFNMQCISNFVLLM